MRSHPAGVRAGKSMVRLAERSFRSEMERQILEIQDAFGVFVDDGERQKQDAQHALREMERQKIDAEDRLRAVEKQKHELERQLRKLQKTLPVQIIRFLRRLNPLRSAL
jgi:chromosome segregation ATPase